MADATPSPFARGTVPSEGRTTRAAFADVHLPQGGRVVFNQTYAPGWRVWPGEVAVDAQRLAVDLPEGRHQVVTRYAPSQWVRRRCTSASLEQRRLGPT